MAQFIFIRGFFFLGELKCTVPDRKLLPVPVSPVRWVNIKKNQVILQGIHLVLKGLLVGFKGQAPRSSQNGCHMLVMPMTGIIRTYVGHTPITWATCYFTFVIAFFSYTGVGPKLQLELRPVPPFSMAFSLFSSAPR